LSGFKRNLDLYIRRRDRIDKLSKIYTFKDDAKKVYDAHKGRF
jgi:hypothetical protein